MGSPGRHRMLRTSRAHQRLRLAQVRVRIHLGVQCVLAELWFTRSSAEIRLEVALSVLHPAGNPASLELEDAVSKCSDGLLQHMAAMGQLPRGPFAAHWAVPVRPDPCSKCLRD